MLDYANFSDFFAIKTVYEFAYIKNCSTFAAFLTRGEFTTYHSGEDGTT